MKKLEVGRKKGTLNVTYNTKDKNGKEVELELADYPEIIKNLEKDNNGLFIIPEEPKDWDVLAKIYGKPLRDKDGSIIKETVKNPDGTESEVTKRNENGIDFVNAAIQNYIEYGGGGLRTNARNAIAATVTDPDKTIKQTMKVYTKAGLFGGDQVKIEALVRKQLAEAQRESEGATA